MFLVHSTYIRIVCFCFLNLNVSPSFFQTFLALNIPQPQPDNYKLFIYLVITVYLLLLEYGLTPKKQLYRQIYTLNHTMKPVTHTHARAHTHTHTHTHRSALSNTRFRQRNKAIIMCLSRKRGKVYFWTQKELGVDQTYSSIEHCSFPLPSTHQRLQQPTVKQFSPLPF